MALAFIVAVVAAKAADEVLRARREINDQSSEAIDLTDTHSHIDLTADDPVLGRQGAPRVGNARVAMGRSAWSWAGLRVQTAEIVGDPSRLPAILGAAGLPLLAGSKGGVHALAIALPLLIIGPLVNRLALQTQRETHRDGAGELDGGPAMGANSAQSLAELGLVMVASLTFGLVGAALVLVARLNATTAVVLVVLVSTYDLGNYLIGTGARSWWEGPSAGVAAMVVVGFASWVAIGPSVGNGVMAAMVGCIAVLCPPGPVLASVLLGEGEPFARGTRRRDVFLVSMPITAYIVVALS